MLSIRSLAAVRPYLRRPKFLFIAAAALLLLSSGYIAAAHNSGPATAAHDVSNTIKNSSASAAQKDVIGSVATPTTTPAPAPAAAPTPSPAPARQPSAPVNPATPAPQPQPTIPKICTTFGPVKVSDVVPIASGVGSVTMRPGCSATLSAHSNTPDELNWQPNAGSFVWSDGQTQSADLPYTVVVGFPKSSGSFKAKNFTYSISVKPDAPAGTYPFSFYAHEPADSGILTVVLTIVN